MINVKRRKLNKRVKRSIIWKMPIEDFTILVKNSSSIGEILKAFGLENKGGNNNTVKRRMQEENIPYDHIKLGKGANKYRNFCVEKIPLEDMLVTNSTSNRYHLKQRLIKENILEYKCNCCGNIGEWKNKKLTLQLEHKNGINNDNRLENLCFLCPNCHSQTATFAGRNVKRATKIKIKKERKKKFSVSKEELETLLNKYPYTKIGQMFGVTDNAVRKRAKQFGIPLPNKRGFWSKKL